MSILPIQKAFVLSCKGVEGGTGDPFVVSLRKEDGVKIGAIRPINLRLSEEDEIAELLTRWRNGAAGFFLTEFVSTIDRTKEWLSSVVVPSENRILFLIEDEEGRRIGHFGVANITQDSLELDNGIRGESGGHPKLFNYVELYVIHLAYECLGVGLVSVRVFSDNMTARRLHRSIGFVEQNRESLVKSNVSEGEFHFTQVESEETNECVGKREQIHLTLERGDFYKKYPWMEAISLPNI